MGDKSLMKKLILIFILTLYGYPSSLSYDEIAQMVTKIKQKRVGIGIVELNETPNPFTIIKKVLKKPKKKIKKKKKPSIVRIIEPTFTLTAILNSKAFINGKWYEIGDKLAGDYRVTYIGDSSVVVSSPRLTKRLKVEPSVKKINLFGGNK